MNSKLKTRIRLNFNISEAYDSLHEDVLKIQDERIFNWEIEDKENREINISEN